MSNLVIFYIPTPSEEKAQELALHLLEKRLIACANIVPCASIYWSQGSLEKVAESILIAKTVPDLANRVEGEVVRVHPYDLPCIMQLTVSVNNDFISWVRDAVKQD